jgi:hypothetical protein
VLFGRDRLAPEVKLEAGTGSWKEESRADRVRGTRGRARRQVSDGGIVNGDGRATAQRHTKRSKTRASMCFPRSFHAFCGLDVQQEPEAAAAAAVGQRGVGATQALGPMRGQPAAGGRGGDGLTAQPSLPRSRENDQPRTRHPRPVHLPSRNNFLRTSHGLPVTCPPSLTSRLATP